MSFQTEQGSEFKEGYFSLPLIAKCRGPRPFLYVRDKHYIEQCTVRVVLEIRSLVIDLNRSPQGGFFKSVFSLTFKCFKIKLNPLYIYDIINIWYKYWLDLKSQCALTIIF